MTSAMAAAQLEPNDETRTQVGPWQWLPATRGFWVDSKWCARTGLVTCTGGDPLESWVQQIHPDDVAEFRRKLEGARAGCLERFELEYRVFAGGQRWIWLLHRGRVIERSEQGEALRLAGICLEIDDRKRAERELRSSEMRLETAVRGAGMGLWELDFRAGSARWYGDWCDRLDLHACEGPDHVARWDANIHPEDAGTAAARFSAHVAGKADYYDAEYRLRDKKGHWRWLFERGRVVERDADGVALRMVGVCMDIEERKEAELCTQEQLRQSEFRYRTVASMSPGYVFECRYNAHGELEPIWSSEGMQAVFGRSPKEWPSGWSSFVDEGWKSVVAASEARLRGGESQSGETCIHTSDGERKWLYVSTFPVSDPQTGVVTGMLGSAYDITTRKLAEQAVRESEAVLRAVTENTPDWLFLVDESLCVRFMNRPFGPYRAEDVLGRSLLEFIPEAHRSKLEGLYRGVLATGQPARFEVRYPVSNNTLSDYEHRVVAVIDGGVVRSLTVAVTDVTDRNRAESALRESRTTLQTVAASSADWLALFDRRRQCVFLNRAMHGVPPEGWIGAPVEDFAPPSDRAYMHEIFEHVMNTGEPRDFDQVIIDPKRGPRYLELRVRAVQADGRIFGAVVNITEVTERHAQQDALRTQGKILETMREGVVLIDATTHLITLTNATFDKMFGYQALELMGRSIDPLFSMPALQRKRFERTLRDNSEAGEVMPVEFECSRKDRSRFVASCVITPLRISGSDRWLAVLNDVTERKRLEREIIEISNREQQRIGSDLHDGLGQDLTGIALMLRGVSAQLRKEGSAARPDVEEVIGLVNNAIENTRSLARGLSPVSGERGGLAAALQNLAARASERYGVRVEFNANFDEPLRLSETSATHVYRIVQEALTNVIRHSRATDVSINLETVSGELHLRVDDNGQGFERPPPDSPGGLGLKIMRYRAQMLGGDLILESGTNGGASVRCSCPLDGAGMETDPSSPPARH
jgi:two-component system, LuxR family, sensor kinase FixL